MGNQLGADYRTNEQYRSIYTQANRQQTKKQVVKGCKVAIELEKDRWKL